MELKELKGLTGHMSHISSIGFSCDGMHIVSGSFSESMHVCDVSKGEELKELEGYTGMVNSVVFSRDGKNIVSCSDDKSVRVWDVSTCVRSPCSHIIIYPVNISHRYHNVPTKITDNSNKL